MTKPLPSSIPSLMCLLSFWRRSWSGKLRLHHQDGLKARLIDEKEKTIMTLTALVKRSISSRNPIANTIDIDLQHLLLLSINYHAHQKDNTFVTVPTEIPKPPQSKPKLKGCGQRYPQLHLMSMRPLLLPFGAPRGKGTLVVLSRGGRKKQRLVPSRRMT